MSTAEYFSDRLAGEIVTLPAQFNGLKAITAVSLPSGTRHLMHLEEPLCDRFAPC